MSEKFDTIIHAWAAYDLPTQALILRAISDYLIGNHCTSYESFEIENQAIYGAQSVAYRTAVWVSFLSDPNCITCDNEPLTFCHDLPLMAELALAPSSAFSALPRTARWARRDKESA